MSDQSTQPTQPPRTPEPHPKLRDLDVLEGTWRLTGRDLASGEETFTGTVIRRWLPGGYFMTQESQPDGQPHEGLEYIGYDSATDSVRSMLFGGEGPGPFCSYALEYFWEITGDQLTICTASRTHPRGSAGRSIARPGSSTARGSGPAAATRRPPPARADRTPADGRPEPVRI